MTPEFALVLSLDGISLLHRSRAGWSELGSVALDDPNLGAGLDRMRTEALRIGGEDFATKVVIPSTQVLFAVLKADASEASVREALEGRTVHKLEDLVLDWQPAIAGRVRIAAVTRETLVEAAQFAAESGFNPIAMVASPEEDQYDGEAWFGAAPGSQLLIDRLGAPRRGDKAVVAALPAAGESAAPQTRNITLSVPEPEVESEAAEPAFETEPEPEADPAPVLFAHRDVTPEPALEPDVQPEPEPEREPETEAEPQFAAAEAPEDEPVAETEAYVPRLGAAEETPGEVAFTPRLGGARRSAEPEQEPADFSFDAESQSFEHDQFAEAEHAPDPEPEAEPEYQAEPEYDEPTYRAEPEEAEAEPAAVAEAEPEVTLTPKASWRDRFKRKPEEAAAPAPAQEADEPEPADAPEAQAAFDPGVSEPEAVADEPAAPRESWLGRLKRKPKDEPPPFSAAAIKADRSERGTDRRFVPPPVKPFRSDSSVEMPPALAKRLGVDPVARGRNVPGQPQLDGSGFNPFGARVRPEQRRNRLATAVVLFGGLGAALAAVWIWASFLPPIDGQIGRFDPDPDASVEAIGNGSSISDPIDPNQVTALESSVEFDPEAEALADGEGELIAEPVPVEEPAADETTELAALPDVPEPTPDETATPEVPLEDSGVTAQTPATNEAPIGERADGIYIAAIDPVVVPHDAIALSDVARDQPIGLQPPPLPPGTTLEFDDRGLVVATEEGALTPDGILVYSVAPEVVPAPRPQSVIDAGVAAAVAASVAEGTPATGDADPAAVDGSEPEAAPDQAADPASETAVPTEPEAGVLPALENQEDNPLFEVKPKPRPINLEETTERSVLGGLTRTELAAFMPVVRPEDLPEPPAAQEESVIGVIAGNEYAPDVSPLPARKPANIQEIAARSTPTPAPTINADNAVAAALGTIAYEPNTKPAATETSSKPAPADEEGEEAEVASVAPSIPTSASVAKQATVKNAIKLGEITLIGVYGSASQRRALVRLPSGKYSKVKVGDRLDGGKVVAIGDSQLQYQKKSKTYTLGMPKA